MSNVSEFMEKTLEPLKQELERINSRITELEEENKMLENINASGYNIYYTLKEKGLSGISLEGIFGDELKDLNKDLETIEKANKLNQMIDEYMKSNQITFGELDILKKIKEENLINIAHEEAKEIQKIKEDNRIKKNENEKEIRDLQEQKEIKIDEVEKVKFIVCDKGRELIDEEFTNDVESDYSEGLKAKLNTIDEKLFDKNDSNNEYYKNFIKEMKVMQDFVDESNKYSRVPEKYRELIDKYFSEEGKSMISYQYYLITETFKENPNTIFKFLKGDTTEGIKRQINYFIERAEIVGEDNKVTIKSKNGSGGTYNYDIEYNTSFEKLMNFFKERVTLEEKLDIVKTMPREEVKVYLKEEIFNDSKSESKYIQENKKILDQAKQITGKDLTIDEIVKLSEKEMDVLKEDYDKFLPVQHTMKREVEELKNNNKKVAAFYENIYEKFDYISNDLKVKVSKREESRVKMQGLKDELEIKDSFESYNEQRTISEKKEKINNKIKEAEKLKGYEEKKIFILQNKKYIKEREEIIKGLKAQVEDINKKYEDYKNIYKEYMEYRDDVNKEFDELLKISYYGTKTDEEKYIVEIINGKITKEETEKKKNEWKKFIEKNDKIDSENLAKKEEILKLAGDLGINASELKEAFEQGNSYKVSNIRSILIAKADQIKTLYPKAKEIQAIDKTGDNIPKEIVAKDAGEILVGLIKQKTKENNQKTKQ